MEPRRPRHPPKPREQSRCRRGGHPPRLRRGSGGAPNATSTLPASAGAKQATAQAPAAASAVAAYGRHLMYQPRRPGHQRHRAECGGCDKFFRFTGLLRCVSAMGIRCLLHRDVQFDAADRRDYRQRLRRIDRVHGGVRNGSKGGCVVSGRLPLRPWGDSRRLRPGQRRYRSVRRQASLSCPAKHARRVSHVHASCGCDTPCVGGRRWLVAHRHHSVGITEGSITLASAAATPAALAAAAQPQPTRPSAFALSAAALSAAASALATSAFATSALATSVVASHRRAYASAATTHAAAARPTAALAAAPCLPTPVVAAVAAPALATPAVATSALAASTRHPGLLPDDLDAPQARVSLNPHPHPLGLQTGRLQGQL